MTLDNALKVSQLVFYSVGVVVAIATFIIGFFTYLTAKRGLLSPVNTEYQKKIIEHLGAVSEELLSEFDPQSNRYWAKTNVAQEVLTRLHADIRNKKTELLAAGKYHGGIPSTAAEQYLDRLIERLKTDPFLPKQIRVKVVDLLENRLAVMRGILRSELDQYANELAQGKHWSSLDDNWGWLSNQINHELYKRGCGISQIQAEVHELRLAIQSYLEKFNPVR